MEPTCGRCKYRTVKNGGCKFSGDEPIVPNLSEKCVFIKSEGRSRFELDEKFEKYGKLIKGYTVDHSPGIAEIRSDPPEPTGYSVICRVNDAGDYVTLKEKNGKLYSADAEMRFVGEMAEVFPPGPSEEEMDRVIKEVRESLMKHFNQGEL